jgi:hypothetical protein
MTSAARTPSGLSWKTVARPRPASVVTFTVWGVPPAGSRTTSLPSRTVHTSARVPAVVGVVKLRPASTGARSPP